MWIKLNQFDQFPLFFLIGVLHVDIIANLLFESSDFIAEWIRNWGYLGIIFLMALESSFFPFPSEVVMIPAGYWAHQGEMSMTLSIGAGIAGSMIGGYFNYYLSAWLGRPVLLKLGHYVGLNEEKLKKVEQYFENHGEITTFVGRLIPGIRQLISCPAGLAKMNIWRFSFYTAAGAGLWVVILAFIGYFIGLEKELIHKYKGIFSIGILVFCAILVAVYVMIKRRNAAKKKSEVAA
jgi:membrane protein DedA with SNARE-associated domain